MNLADYVINLTDYGIPYVINLADYGILYAVTVCVIFLVLSAMARHPHSIIYGALLGTVGVCLVLLPSHRDWIIQGACLAGMIAALNSGIYFRRKRTALREEMNNLVEAVSDLRSRNILAEIRGTGFRATSNADVSNPVVPHEQPRAEMNRD